MRDLGVLMNRGWAYRVNQLFLLHRFVVARLAYAADMIGYLVASAASGDFSPTIADHFRLLVGWNADK